VWLGAAAVAERDLAALEVAAIRFRKFVAEVSLDQRDILRT
jgi:hypothetical protein